MKKILLGLLLLTVALNVKAGTLYVTNNTGCNEFFTAHVSTNRCGIGAVSAPLVMVDALAGTSTTYSVPGYWFHATSVNWAVDPNNPCPNAAAPAPGCPNLGVSLHIPYSGLSPSAGCITQVRSCNVCTPGTVVTVTLTDLGGGDASLVYN